MARFHPAAAAIDMISTTNRGLKASGSATSASRTSTIGNGRESSRLVDISSVWSVGVTGLSGCKCCGWRLGVRSAGGLWRVLVLGDSIRYWGTLEFLDAKIVERVIMFPLYTGSWVRVRVLVFGLGKLVRYKRGQERVAVNAALLISDCQNPRVYVFF
jgi:hypothetical protein